MVTTRKQHTDTNLSPMKNTFAQNFMYYSKKTIFSPIGGFIGLVFATTFVHWLLINLYVNLCAPPTLFGMFSALLALGSPLCHFINITQVELAKHYITIWSVAGVSMLAWLASKLSWKST